MRKSPTVLLVALLGAVVWFATVPSMATPINHSFVTGYESVDESTTVVSVNSVVLTATCPEGLHVLGGGGTSSTDVGQFAMRSSNASASDTAWTVRWHSSGSQADGSFTVTALCANTD